MGRLVLLRHGEAEWPTADQSDADRPLTDYGREQAQRVAELLHEHTWLPEQIVSSTANRALTTAKIVADALGITVDVTDTLYEGGLHEVRKCLGATSPERGTVMLVGHNPTFSAVASTLTGVSVSLGTGHAALLSHEGTNWSETAWLDSVWSLNHHLVPA